MGAGERFGDVCPTPHCCLENVVSLIISALTLLALAVVIVKLLRRLHKHVGGIGRKLWLPSRKEKGAASFAVLANFLVLVLCLVNACFYLPDFLFILYGDGPPTSCMFQHGMKRTSIAFHALPRLIMAIMHMLWHVEIIHATYCWVVLKHSVARIHRRKAYASLWVLGLGVACIIASLTLVTIPKIAMELYLILFFFITFFVLPITAIVMGRMYVLTVHELRGIHVPGSEEDRDTLLNRVSNRLLHVCLAMLLAWAISIILDAVIWIIYVRTHPHYPLDLPRSMFLLRLVLYRLSGLLDTTILGGLFDGCILSRLSSGSSQELEEERRQQEGIYSVPQWSLAPGQFFESSILPPPPIPASESVSEAHIFAVTYNMGGMISGAKAIRTLFESLPKLGICDLYIIALQECVALTETRAVIHGILGGPAEFTMFKREIGDAVVLNGMIAVTVFARTCYVESGAIMVYDAVADSVNTGLKLGPLGQAPNKGALGLSVRYHDASLAVIATHFAADSRGSNRVWRRHQDSVMAFRKLSLAWDSEFDPHLEHQHTILLGDLNYRIRGPPSEVLCMLAESALEEKCQCRNKNWRAERRRKEPWTPLPTASTYSKYNSSSTSSGSNGFMRKDSTTDSFLPLFGRGRNRLEAAAAAEGGEKEVVMMEEGSKPPQGKKEATHDDDLVDGQKKEEEEEAGEQQQQTLCMPNLHYLDIANSTTGSSQHPAADSMTSSIPCPPTKVHYLTTYVVEGEENQEELQQSRHWQWIRQHDELSWAMSNHMVMYGFKEKPIKFPPSYRWERFVDPSILGDFTNPLTLAEAYCLSVSGKQRTPSYTDRILTFSLPDKRHKMRVHQYDIVEGVLGSDHRPVYATISLAVDRNVYGFEQKKIRASSARLTGLEQLQSIQLDQKENGPIRRISVEISAMAFDFLDGDSPQYQQQQQAGVSSVSDVMIPLGHYNSTSSTASGTLPLTSTTSVTLPLSNSNSVNLHLSSSASVSLPVNPVSSPCTHHNLSVGSLLSECKAYDSSTMMDDDDEDDDGTESMCSSPGRHHAKKGNRPKITAADIAEVIVTYPLVSEDPLASFRRLWSMGSLYLDASSSSISSSTSSIGCTKYPQGLQSSIRRGKLPDKGRALKMEFYACRYFSEHAAIKFVGHDGSDLGQGVIQVLESTHDYHAKYQGLRLPLTIPDERMISMELTSGGIPMGSVTFATRVHVDDLTSIESSFLSSDQSGRAAAVRAVAAVVAEGTAPPTAKIVNASSLSTPFGSNSGADSLPLPPRLNYPLGGLAKARDRVKKMMSSSLASDKEEEVNEEEDGR